MAYVRRKLNKGAKAKLWQIRFLVQKYGGKCYLCHRDFISKKEITIDHLVPRSGGGSDNIENLRLACKGCNTAKDSLSLEEYAVLQEGF